MTPALVLGSPHGTTLEVIRILGRRDIPQFVVGTGQGFVAWSRWYRPLQGRRPEDLSPASLPEFLAGKVIERAALIPCTDEWVRAIGNLDPALADRFPASLAPRESLDILLDKGRFADAAERLGVPHPRTVSVASEDDLAALPDSALRDSFLKPRHTLAFQARFGVKAFRFQTRAQAAEIVREAHRAGLRLTLQEYIPGPPTNHYFFNGFVDRTGALCARIATRRLRMFPADFGDGCHGMSIRLEEVIPATEIVARFLAPLRYRGVFNAEFKYDERDGLFKVLEINVRPYAYVGFAAECGVDLVTMAYQDALDLPVDHAAAYAVGRHYFYPAADRVAGWRLIRERKLTPWSWARSWVGAYQPIFSWDDPFPAGEKVATRIRSFFRRPAAIGKANGTRRSRGE